MKFIVKRDVTDSDDQPLVGVFDILGGLSKFDRWATLWLRVESEDDYIVTGRIMFPDRGKFEFSGSLERLTKEIRRVGNGYGLMQSDSFSFYRD